MRKSKVSLMLAAMASAAGAAEPPAEPDRYQIPSTVSPGGTRGLEALYALLKQRPTPQRPVTVADWDRDEEQLSVRYGPLLAQVADRLGVTRTNEVMGGVPVVRIRPPGWKPTGRTLVYVHGGGYVTFRASYALAIPAQAVVSGGDEVISIDYTLAPHSRWQKTTDQVLSVWRALLSQHSPASMGIFGDSAGGGLVAGSVLKMRDQHLPLPGAVYLLSPWSDLTGAGDTISTLASADPVLDETVLKWDAAAYADPVDQKNPYVSPVYGDFSKAFPPTMIQGGTREIFISDEVRLYQAILAGGHEAVLDLYEGMPHVHPTAAPGSPEAVTAVGRGVKFFHAHLIADKLN